jgi:hypothetical protein
MHFKNHAIFKTFIILVVFLFLFTIIPYPVHASASLVYEYPERTVSNNPSVYLTHGPGTPVPAPPPPPPPLPFGTSDAPAPPPPPFYAVETGTPLNVVSGTILYMNTTPATNFLQVNNTLGITVTLWINGSLPSNVAMYVNNTTYSPGSGKMIVLKPDSSPAVDIGFGVIGRNKSDSTFLYFDYRLSSGVFVIYKYPIYANE